MVLNRILLEMSITELGEHTQQKGIVPLQRSLSCALQYSYLSVTCFNQWVVTVVAHKLKIQWFWEVDRIISNYPYKIKCDRIYKKGHFDNFKKIELGSQTSTPTNAPFCYQKLNHYEHCMMRYASQNGTYTIQPNRVYRVNSTVKLFTSVDTSACCDLDSDILNTIAGVCLLLLH